MSSISSGRLRTSGCELGALAGAAVVVSVLGAKLGASVGEAAGPSSWPAEALGMKAGFGKAEKKEKCVIIIETVLGNFLAVQNYLNFSSSDVT